MTIASLLQVLIGAIAVIAMFLVLVGPHEGGHFALAKLFRVRVHEFSIGMGTRLLGRTLGGTAYNLRLIPIGGYVRLAGMEPDDLDAADGFPTKPAHQRFLILLAGPAVNFLVAALIVTGISLTQLNSDPGRVGAVMSGRAAYAQGLRPGDSIVSVDGRPVRSAADIRAAEDARPGAPLSLVVRRPGGTELTMVVTPAYDQSYRRYLIGIQNAPLVGVGDALRTGALFPVTATVAIGQGIGQLLTGGIPGGALGPQGVTGPIGIGYVTIQAADHGVVDWLTTVAILSMALGLANLLPLPALDGGRMLVVVLERLRGRPFDRDREMAVQRFGLVALLGLMLVIAFFDVQRIATGAFPSLH